MQKKPWKKPKNIIEFAVPLRPADLSYNLISTQKFGFWKKPDF
jgi:hypothetical protein